MVIYDYDIPGYDIWHMMFDETVLEQNYGHVDRVNDSIIAANCFIEEKRCLQKTIFDG